MFLLFVSCECCCCEHWCIGFCVDAHPVFLKREERRKNRFRESFILTHVFTISSSIFFFQWIYGVISLLWYSSIPSFILCPIIFIYITPQYVTGSTIQFYNYVNCFKLFEKRENIYSIRITNAINFTSFVFFCFFVFLVWCHFLLV